MFVLLVIVVFVVAFLTASVAVAGIAISGRRGLGEEKGANSLFEMAGTETPLLLGNNFSAAFPSGTNFWCGLISSKCSKCAFSKPA